nr:energy transducer TonB [Vogesella oryzae]
MRFVKERADFVSLRRQQRRRTIPTRPKPVNTPIHKNRHEFDKSLIRKEAKTQKRLAAANLFNLSTQIWADDWTLQLNLFLAADTLTAIWDHNNINANRYHNKWRIMEPRAFHYGTLAVIASAHLGLLALAATRSLPQSPAMPVPLEVVSIVETQSTTEAPSLAQPRPQPLKPSSQVASPTTVRTAPQQRASRQIADAAMPATPLPTTSTAQPTLAPTSHSPAAEQTAPAAPPAITPPTHTEGYLHNPKPEYPPLSLELGEEGTVLLQIAVNSNGKATSVSIARSSGFPRLDNAARRAASNWTFHPAMRGDEAIDYSYTTPIQFVLPDKTKA